MLLFVVVTGKCFVEPESPTVHHSFLRFTSRFISTGLLGSLIRQVSKKSSRRDLRMSFNQLVGETFVEAWERYHGLMTDLPIAGMDDWEFTEGCCSVLPQEAKEHIDILAGGMFFISTLKKRELSLRSFPLAKGRVRRMV
jgi:hypothetical protein